MQSESKGTIMLALASVSSTLFMGLEPLAKLLLLAASGNLCLTGATGTLVGAAMLAPTGATSTPFRTGSTLEFLYLELLPGLQLLAPLGNL